MKAKTFITLNQGLLVFGLFGFILIFARIYSNKEEGSIRNLSLYSYNEMQNFCLKEYSGILNKFSNLTKKNLPSTPKKSQKYSEILMNYLRTDNEKAYPKEYIPRILPSILFSAISLICFFMWIFCCTCCCCPRCCFKKDNEEEVSNCQVFSLFSSIVLSGSSIVGCIIFFVFEK